MEKQDIREEDLFGDGSQVEAIEVPIEERDSETIGREVNTEKVVQNLVASKIEMELQRGYREVEIPDIGLVHIHRPTVEINYSADLVYAEELTRLMTDSKLKTIDEMQDTVMSRLGVNRKKLEDMATELANYASEILVAKTEFAKNPRKTTLRRKIETLEKEHAELKKKFMEDQNKYHKFMAMTIEGKADELRLIYKMAACITDPPGS
jgi:hypothetical protein